jgi:hypothetical protein
VNRFAYRTYVSIIRLLSCTTIRLLSCITIRLLRLIIIRLLCWIGSGR